MEYYFAGQLSEESNGQRKTSSSPLYGADDAVIAGLEMEEVGNSQPSAACEPMDQALQHQYTEELKQVEEEIKTLQQVLTARYARQHYLRRQLGISAISELRDEVMHGIENLRTSDAYQRTTAVMKSAKNKTSAAIQEKWSLFRNTSVFKSLEEKVGPAYTSVRGKLMRTGGTEAEAMSPAGESTANQLTPTNVDGGDVSAQTRDVDTPAGEDAVHRRSKVPTAPIDRQDSLPVVIAPEEAEDELDLVRDRPAEAPAASQSVGGGGAANRRKSQNQTRQNPRR